MQTSALVVPFNIVLKELVVLVNGKTEDAAVLSAVKKAFRVFSTEGTTYIDEYGDDLAGTPGRKSSTASRTPRRAGSLRKTLQACR
jgi:hypothetical protein